MDLVTETDSGLAFHIQKFALLTETLAVNQGNAVLPMGTGRQGIHLRDVVDVGFSALIGQINDGRDFREYVLDFSGQVPSRTSYPGPAATPNPNIRNSVHLMSNSR